MVMVMRVDSPRVRAAESEYERLLREKETIDRDLAEIKAQLTEARANVARSGEYADPEWWNRALFAARRKARESQRLQREIGEAKRKLGKLRNAEYDRCFIEAARGLLDVPVFQRIENAARQLSERRAAEAEPQIGERLDHGSPQR